MLLLQPDNTAFNIDAFPDRSTFELSGVSEQISSLRYCVLDYSDQKDVDFYFVPPVFLDQFTLPAADLQIGQYRVQMPLDWSIVIADKDFGHMEIIEIKHLNDRPFTAFMLNPIKGYMPEFGEISIENVFPDVTWTMPKLKFGHILVVPLDDCPSPPCALFVRETNRLPETLDITKVFS